MVEVLSELSRTMATAVGACPEPISRQPPRRRRRDEQYRENAEKHQQKVFSFSFRESLALGAEDERAAGNSTRSEMRRRSRCSSSGTAAAPASSR